MSSDHPTLRRQAPPLPNLTALRFFAALMVVVYHFTNNGRDLDPRNPLTPFFSQGYLGVPLFFVLSGFVLAYSHVSVPNRRRFYWARFARVYPMAVVAFLAVLPFAILRTVHFHQHFPLAVFPLNMLLLQAWTPSLEYFVNGPEWTLSVEAFFYLLFPILLPPMVKYLHRRWFWIIGIWALFMVQPLVSSHPHLGAHLGLSSAVNTILYGVANYTDAPPSFLGEFVMGVFAGAQFRRHPQTFSGWIVAGGVLLSAISLYLSPHLGFTLVRNSGIALAFLLLILALSGWRSPILASRPVQLGGEISYSMYLLQMVILEISFRVPPAWRSLPLMIPALLAISLLAYLYIEKPARSFILRTLDVKAPAEPLPAPRPDRVAF